MKKLPVLVGLLFVLLIFPAIVLAEDANITATAEATTVETTIVPSTTVTTIATTETNPVVTDITITETTTAAVATATSEVTTEATTEITTEATTEPTSTYGSIYVESDPEGAAVYLNSSYQGVTPLTLSSITPGYYDVLLTLEGYCDSINTVGVVTGDEADIYDTLISVNGTLYFYSSPSGASIYLNSVYQGLTPLTLYNVTAGTYTVLLQLSGYDDLSGSYEVTAGNQTSVYNSFTSSVAETTVPPTETTSTAVMTTFRTSSVTVPTAWPTDTTPASPVGALPVLGGIGLALLVLKKY
jgi:hypothetical protein